MRPAPHINFLDSVSLMDSNEFSEEIDEIKKLEYEQLINVIPKIMLKPQTIQPDEGISALFACETRNMDSEKEGYFEITVSFDREYHKFVFTRTVKD